MIEHPFETRSDSFYFVDDRLIMHNKADYSYDGGIWEWNIECATHWLDLSVCDHSLLLLAQDQEMKRKGSYCNWFEGPTKTIYKNSILNFCAIPLPFQLVAYPII